MRHPIFLSAAILLLSTVTLHAQSALISGKITNRLSDEITFTSYQGILEFNSVERVAMLDKDGKFSVVFPVNTDYTEISIQHGDQASELVLRDGDAVDMTLDAKDFDKTMHYTGKGATAANFVAKRVLDRGLSRAFSANFQPLMAKEPQEFMPESKGLLQQELDYLEQNKQGLPDAFIKYWTASFSYNVYYNWLIYPPFHRMMTGKDRDASKIPKEHYSVPANIPMTFDDDLLSISSYRNVVGSIFENRTGTMDSVQALKYRTADSSSILAKQLLPPKSREFYFANKLKNSMKYATVAKADSDYYAFKKMYPKSEFLPIIDKSIAIKRKLGAGQPAIDFAFTSLDGKKMKLSDLKGKVVYIDFWASWCGPCMNELPSAKKVKEHFKDRDLVFLNVSIDEDMVAWKSAIARKEIEGIHVCEPGGWKAPIALMYGIQSVPSHFLVDKKGNFVSEVTPRPSQTDELIGLIEGALK